MEKEAKASGAKASKKDKKDKKDTASAKALAKEQKRKKQEEKAMRKEKKKSGKLKGGPGGRKDSDVEDDVDDEEFERIVAEIMKRDLEHNQVTVTKLSEDPSFRASFSMCPAGNNTQQDGLVIFGGEYFDGATSKCYDEVLRVRLLTSGGNTGIEWKMITSPNSPPPRCAHSTCCTATHAYIFGGEFSTAWRFHHYNDLWRLDLKTNQWTNMPSVGGPSPRSGARMVAWKHFLIVFGGFYEASRGVRWHDDLYFYDLRSEKWSKARMASTSQQPSARSGFAFCAHPNKPLVFLYGGYSKVVATASNQKGRALDDMWVLSLSMPQTAKQSSSSAFPECRWEMVPRKGQAPTKRSGAAACVFKNRLLLFGGVSDVETNNDVVGNFYNQLFAFDMDRMRWFELQLRAAKQTRKRRTGGKKETGSTITGNTSKADSLEDFDDYDGEDYANNQSEDDDDDNDGAHGPISGLRDDAMYVIIDGKFVLIEADPADDEEDTKADVDKKVVPGTTGTLEVVSEVAKDLEQLSVADSTTRINGSQQAQKKQEQPPWNGLPAPDPRIQAGAGVIGSKLFIYGGACERGDKQITFDDAWTLDLNKLDAWQHIVPGKWQEQSWAGATDEDEEDDETDSEGDDETGSHDGSEEESESEDDDENSAVENIRALGEEIKALRDELGVSEENNTPNPGESVRDFFSRTAQHWLSEVAKTVQADERLTGKELRRKAFEKARFRFDLLEPLLEKLNALQEAQRLAEEEAEEEARALAEKIARRKAKKALHQKKKEERA